MDTEEINKIEEIFKHHIGVMSEAFQRKIEHQTGIISEDFQHKLDIVVEGHQTPRNFFEPARLKH